MKCNLCIYEWTYAPDWTSPYGEWACTKKECDLYGAKDEDVENCADYQSKAEGEK